MAADYLRLGSSAKIAISLGKKVLRSHNLIDLDAIHLLWGGLGLGNSPVLRKIGCDSQIARSQLSPWLGEGANRIRMKGYGGLAPAGQMTLCWTVALGPMMRRCEANSDCIIFGALKSLDEPISEALSSMGLKPHEFYAAFVRCYQSVPTSFVDLESHEITLVDNSDLDQVMGIRQTCRDRRWFKNYGLFGQ